MADDETPISWMTLEKGVPVHSSDGAEVGRVSEIVADIQKDIFSGVSFREGLLGSEHFAPAELIEELTAAAVRLNVPADEATSLDAPSR